MRAIASNIRHKMFDTKPLPDYTKMTYLEILESAWQDHLAPRDENAPTVISTFAGGGGSSLGYSMAGYKKLLAVEWDNNAVATYKANFPDTPVYHGDIAKLSVEECMRLAGLTEEGELDLFGGSPPCQGLSMAGKRILDDPRNQLYKQYVRLLRGLKPKVFVMENVSGMVKGKMKLLFAEIMRELKASGYQVRCKLMNTMYFHVPQSRERLIWIGVRNDLVGNGDGKVAKVSFPKVESRPVTVRKAFKDVEDDGFLLSRTGGKIVGKMKQGDSGKMHAKQCGHELVRLFWNKPSPTLNKIFRLSGAMGLIHPTEDRHIGLNEAKRIGSFPDSFSLLGESTAKQWGVIGNSVPPLFMRSIANHIKQQILLTTKPSRRRGS